MKRRPTTSPAAPAAMPGEADRVARATTTAAAITEQPAPPIACQLTPAEVNAMLETILANRGGGYSPIIVINCGGNYGTICGTNHDSAAPLQDRHSESNAQTVNAHHNDRADIIGAHNAAEGGARLQTDEQAQTVDARHAATVNVVNGEQQAVTIPRAQIAGSNSRQMQSE